MARTRRFRRRGTPGVFVVIASECTLVCIRSLSKEGNESYKQDISGRGWRGKDRIDGIFQSFKWLNNIVLICKMVLLRRLIKSVF
jgi:hypothetical protein